MSRYIISERWQYTDQSGAAVVAGVAASPTLLWTGARLTAAGLFKGSVFAAPVLTKFDNADSVLVKRIRIWSPMCALGLVGASTTDSHSLVLTAADPVNVYNGQSVKIYGPLVLGEWVDVNQTLNRKGLPGGGANWCLAVDMNQPITLDGSRVNSAVISGGALVALTVQVDLAHSLPAVA